MTSASGSNPVPGDETNTGTEKEDKAKDNSKASADPEVERNKKLEEQLRECKGEVQRKEERIQSLQAELEARNAEVKKLKREKESITREAAIKEKVSPHRQFDVAFLVHVHADGNSGTMKNFINYGIMKYIEKLKSESKNLEWELRIAFAPYRDPRDRTTLKFDFAPCDFTHKFTTPSFLIDSLSHCSSNMWGSQPVQYFKDYLAKFDWQATNRVIIHITRDGRTPDDFKDDIKKASGGSLVMDMKFEEVYFQDSKVLARLLDSLKLRAVRLPITKYLPEEIYEQRLPIEKSGGLQCQSYFEHTWCTELPDLITKIKENKDLLYMDRRAKVHVQIAKKPFRNDHHAVWPFRATVTVDGEAPKPAVAYRFKTPVENSQYPASFTEDLHKADRYLARMEVHSVAAQMARAFNERIGGLTGYVEQLHCPRVITLSIDSGENEEFYNVVIEDSKGFANTTDQHVHILQAFTHWTHHISGALLMVQIYPKAVGLRQNSTTGYDDLCFEDPVIHCSDVMRFITHRHIDIHTNLGSEGYNLFFASHKCNEVCENLGITTTNMSLKT